MAALRGGPPFGVAVVYAGQGGCHLTVELAAGAAEQLDRLRLVLVFVPIPPYNELPRDKGKFFMLKILKKVLKIIKT